MDKKVHYNQIKLLFKRDSLVVLDIQSAQPNNFSRQPGHFIDLPKENQILFLNVNT